MRTAIRTTALAIGAALFLAGAGHAQTGAKPLDHDDYERWRSIEDRALSDDGRWVAYALQPPNDGDGTLHVRGTESDAHHRVDRGADGRFSPDGRFVAFRIDPHREAVRQAKLDDAAPDEMPGDSLGILDLETGAVTRIARVQSFRLPEDGGGWIAVRLEAPADSGGGAEAGEADGDAENEDDGDGATLVLHELETGEQRRYDSVTEYRFSKDGARLVFATDGRADDADGVFAVELESGAVAALRTGPGEYARLALDESGEQVAFVASDEEENADDDAADAPPVFALYHWRTGAESARAIADSATAGVPGDWTVSEHGEVRFSKNGERLFFGTAPRPEPEPEADEVPEDEKVEVDVWHWEDPYLQPMQLDRLDRERERSYLAVVHLSDDRVVQLATETVPEVRVGADGDADVALGTSVRPYRKLLSWDWPRYRDAYIVDVESGERRKLLTKTQARPRLSPGARYVTWYDNREQDWFVHDIEDDRTVNATAEIRVPLYREEHDRPYPAPAHGLAGWTEDDGALLVYDRHDIWAVDPDGGDAPRSITEGVGRVEDIRFRRVDLDPDEDAIDPDEPVLLSSFDDATKASGFHRDRVRGDARPERLVFTDHRFSRPRKAEDADVLLYTRESFREFPDLWVGDLGFEDTRRISDANPQQSEYRWGRAELIEYRSAHGEPLQGLLYTPDGFDPDQTHPLMVYFYERNSDNLHRHWAPQVHGSIINITFYLSRGYVVFVPDVVYRTGYPGESALDCVVPGVLELVDRGFVDEDAIGIQGHSWGGYQIAYLVTKTDLFAAAEAGAPVSNMTSAYGGIRWGTGMSRMFQYERTQSRLGGSLWEKPIRYLENSPLFWADKIRTPLLMMHNDADTAVPWYQGIELFVALRRLGKPAWLLNYNGEPHNLPDYADRRDWAIRMQQFFDHYLKDAPPPVWLAEGVPATRKGETLGLELIEEERATTEDTTHE